MRYLTAFIAGALSVLVFHQGLAGLLFEFGLVAHPPYSLASVAPFGVPQVLSSAFWGGLWGIAVAPLLMRVKGTARYWILAVVIGAIAPSLVAWFVIAPLKGQAIAGGGEIGAIARGLCLNAAWGLGLGALLWLADRAGITRGARLDRAA
jgi:hypothetical protein